MGPATSPYSMIPQTSRIQASLGEVQSSYEESLASGFKTGGKRNCLGIPGGVGKSLEKKIFTPGTLLDPPSAPTLYLHQVTIGMGV